MEFLKIFNPLFSHWFTKRQTHIRSKINYQLHENASKLWLNFRLRNKQRISCIIWYQNFRYFIHNSASYKPLTFKIESSKEKTNFFTQMISSYSSLAFFNNNKYIASRDFLTVKVWDVSKTDKPLLSITIQDAIKSKLC